MVAAADAVLEDRQPLIGHVPAQDVRRIGVVVLCEADDVLRAAPVVGTIAVGVGDDHRGGVVHRTHQRGVAERGAVANELRSVDQSGGCRVDESVTAAGDEHLPILDPDDADRIVDGCEDDWWDRLADATVRCGLLVDHRDDREVAHCVAVRIGPTEVRRAGEEVEHELGARRSEALEGSVAGDPDRVGTEQPGDRGERGRLGNTCLEAVVECVDEIHRRSASQRQQVAGDERPFGQPGQRRIDGVPPAERAELGTGQLQHAVAGGRGVEIRSGLEPRRWRVLVPFERRVDESVIGERRKVHDGQEDDATAASGRSQRLAGMRDAPRPSISAAPPSARPRTSMGTARCSIAAPARGRSRHRPRARPSAGWDR